MTDGPSSPDQTPPLDLTQGVSADRLPDGAMLEGQVGGEPVLLARVGSEIFAVGARCSHYGGPLREGLLVGATVRCPWHHACFDLQTGRALRAPAFDPLPCYAVERKDDRIVVLGKPLPPTPSPVVPVNPDLQRVVIAGGGAAGFACAHRLRAEGFQGSITLLSADDAPPVDRPNLSKDYLAGTAPEEWIPLRPEGYYREQKIDLKLGTVATNIDLEQRSVLVKTGERFPYDALLLCTGGTPRQLNIPGAELHHVYLVRSLASSRALIAAAQKGRRVAIVGCSFLGLEVAAALRQRNLEVHVIGPEVYPLEKTMGRPLGDFLRRIHEEHGVLFHLQTTVRSIEAERVLLENNQSLSADLVVLALGVTPETHLAETAGLKIDRGVLVNEFLETSVPGIYAAGDIARWPSAQSPDRIRAEHWVVAERQGETVALNMLKRRERFVQPPFFWSVHYDLSIRYVGHAERWERTDVVGQIDRRDCRINYMRLGKTMAVATIGRDRENLEAELRMERAAERP